MLQSFMITVGPTSSSPLHPLHSVECHSACTVYPEPRREPSRSERSEGFAFDFSHVYVSANVDALDAASIVSPLFATLTKNTRGWVSVPIINPIFRFNDRPISNSHRITFFAHPHPLTPMESNSCKNRGEGSPLRRAVSARTHVSGRHAGILATPILSWAYFITRGHPGWGVHSPLFSAQPQRTLRLCVIFIPSRLSAFNSPPCLPCLP
jgi:hypothetical protein